MAGWGKAVFREEAKDMYGFFITSILAGQLG